ncbi:MAG: acylphosphatase [Ruminococcus sp.]|nr:acylphosphatase [Ruminococcus sp.]MBQ3856974.1 acylphosphatase [Ruminococcus sp.]HOO05668.1 acylphosphatase [Ruminococcus sp.]HOR22153.1 acylphosphatase [Ruminococcus sp.]
MEKLRRHIIFYGAVQGVGFRYRAYHAANSLGVTGWVKNLWDGSVEMEAEGSEEAIDRMIMAIERGTFVRIENISAKTIPLQNDRSFQIL